MLSHENNTAKMETSDVKTLPDEIQKLIRESEEMKKSAYCLHTYFRVGSALLAKDGRIFLGCNVENASSSLTVCAERCAIFKAVSEGCRDFKAIAVASDVSDGVRDHHIGPWRYPCDACRQVIFEFAPRMDIYFTRPDGTFTKSTAVGLIYGSDEMTT